jgi:nitrogen PTS system EIIA component
MLPMNQIAQLLPAANVLLDLEAGSKSQLFAAVGRLFETNCGLRSELVIESLLTREKLGSTGLGQGIAIPHGRIKGLREAQGAFARLKAPIPFDAPDGKPVAQVFVLLVPEHATEQHLQLLSELAQMFSEKNFRELLAAANDAPTLHKLFRQWEAA